MIHFSSEIGFWSIAVFWYVVINAALCLGFTVVVIIGGAGDLHYLIQALRHGETDESDNGTVEPRAAEGNLSPPSHEASE